MILVTGASRGLGRAIADHLHAEGNDVLGISRTAVNANFSSIACDVSDSDALRAVAAELRKQDTRLTALINAAGVASMNLALMTPAKTAEQIMRTNLLGTIYCCQQFSPLLIRNGGGAIINFSTIAVALGLEGEAVYSASKAGVESFSRAFARELSAFGVRVNCIAPGPIQTDLIQGVPPEKIQAVVSRQIERRMYSKEDLCDLVDVMLSTQARGLTGQVLHLGGV